MRAIRLAAVACLVMLACGVSAYPSQAPARDVETRWQNCSQIVRGRLGALHNWEGQIILPEFENLIWLNWTFTFSPCAPTYLRISGPPLTPVVATMPLEFTKVFLAGSDTATDAVNQDQRIVTFTMPDTPEQVPHLDAKYATVGSETIAVTVSCDSNGAGKNATITYFNWTTTPMVLTLSSIEGCARFPYTNKSFPTGGVVAFIIVVLCVALEGAACFKYHKDNKNHAMLEDESMLPAATQ